MSRGNVHQVRIGRIYKVTLCAGDPEDLGAVAQLRVPATDERQRDGR